MVDLFPCVLPRAPTAGEGTLGASREVCAGVARCQEGEPTRHLFYMLQRAGGSSSLFWPAWRLLKSNNTINGWPRETSRRTPEGACQRGAALPGRHEAGARSRCCSTHTGGHGVPGALQSGAYGVSAVPALQARRAEGMGEVQRGSGGEGKQNRGAAALPHDWSQEDTSSRGRVQRVQNKQGAGYNMKTATWYKQGGIQQVCWASPREAKGLSFRRQDDRQDEKKQLTSMQRWGRRPAPEPRAARLGSAAAQRSHHRRRRCCRCHRRWAGPHGRRPAAASEPLP